MDLKSLTSVSLEIVACLKEQKKRGELFPDLVLQVESTEIPCHRFILSACSGFFRGLLVSGMKEDQQQRVTITGISLDTVQLVLDMIYTGGNLLTAENMIDVWHATNQLEILFLLRLCESFINNHINDVNCCEIYENAKLLDSKAVITPSWKYIIHHFESVRFSLDILQLPVKDVISLVQSQNLYTKSEDHVIEFILNWINYNPTNQNTPSPVYSLTHQLGLAQGENHISLDKSVISSTRIANSDNTTTDSLEPNENETLSKSYKESVLNLPAVCQKSALRISERQSSDRWKNLEDLLAATRFFLLSGRALTQLLSSEHIVTNPQAMCLIKEIITFQSNSIALDNYIPSSGLYRTSVNHVNAIVWLTSVSEKNKSISLMDVESKQTKKLELKSSFIINSLIVYRNMIYLLSGEEINMFDFIFKNLLKLTDPEPVSDSDETRSGHTFVCVADFVYIVGGRHNVDGMNIGKTGSLRTVGSLPVSVTSTICIVLGSNIVVLGSSNGRQSVTTVQCFNTETSSSYHIQDIDEPPQDIAVFNKLKAAFVLFSTGHLWTFEVSETNVVSAKFVHRLWSFNRSLTGSVLVGDKLFVFDKNSEKEVEPTWSVSVPGVFNSIHNHRNATGQFFHPMSVPRNFFDSE